jgi:H+/Na+-translocating ferredoxin:NAD+ oxidoreductase subunit B
MNDAYKALADHLDRLPAGYPSTESGVELRILKRLFSPDEAEIAVGLQMVPEPVSVIAGRLGRDDHELAPILEAMSRKGLIFRLSRKGQKSYMAAQFVIGLWEYHLNDLDEALIRDVNEYLPLFMKKGWVDVKTKQLRVIPISKKITAEMTIMPYEIAEEIINRQSKIVVAPCICRKEHEMLGKGCGKPMEVCLSFGSGAYFYEENGLGRDISRQEALEILNTGREAGLVLQPSNSQKPTNICMCCGCCCQVLKNLKTLPNPARMVHTNYYAEVDAGACIACEACADRCHMDAIRVEASAWVDPERCIGCGVCVGECPTDAIAFKQKEAQDQYLPPRNGFETYVNIARDKGIL